MEPTLGPGSVDALAADADRRMDGFASDARQIYRDFMIAVPGVDTWPPSARFS